MGQQLIVIIGTLFFRVFVRHIIDLIIFLLMSIFYKRTDTEIDMEIKLDNLNQIVRNNTSKTIDNRIRFMEKSQIENNLNNIRKLRFRQKILWMQLFHLGSLVMEFLFYCLLLKLFVSNYNVWNILRLSAMSEHRYHVVVMAVVCMVSFTLFCNLIFKNVDIYVGKIVKRFNYCYDKFVSRKNK